jgi:hypothetical protein
MTWHVVIIVRVDAVVRIVNIIIECYCGCGWGRCCVMVVVVAAVVVGVEVEIVDLVW